MKKPLFHGRGRIGFTLVEMLVSLVIFALLMIMLNAMIGTTSRVIGGTRKLLSMDDEARLIFGLMAGDFSQMPHRNDVDTIFARQGGNGNDKIFFYSASAASSSPTSVTSTSQLDPVSLVGYCITADVQGTPINSSLPGNYLQDLHRLGHGLSWDTNNGSTDNMVYLTFTAGTAGPNPNSTLNGHWPALLGAAPSYPSPTPLSADSTDFHTVGNQVVRFEYCFLLNDGTYSNYPAENYAPPATGGVTFTSNLSATSAPGITDDSKNDSGRGYFTVGSRWYNKDDGRAYICTDPTAEAAVWAGLGVQDISGIVVALVLVDRDSRNIVTSAANWQALPAQFTDPTDGQLNPGGATPQTTPPTLMQQTWQGEVNALLAHNTAGLPAAVLGHVRIYQRCFYLNTSAL